MPKLPSWLPQAPASAPVPGSTPQTPAVFKPPRPKDPNAPDYRLQIATKCIYERSLPGGSYITAHIHRLQAGYYDSPVVHEDCISHVRFAAIHFTFHEASTDRRFKSAKIRLSVHDANRQPRSVPPLPPQLDHPADDHSSASRVKEHPKFLRYAPHLVYGAMSPETLDWNFNLAGSLGVSQTPVSASLNPSGGVKSSYKVYKMMKIQGSLRTNSSWFGKNYDVEDGELVWTLEENYLQKSGLPREFTFVVLMTKGDPSNDVRFEVDIEPEVASWFGHFPQWWVHTLKYQPLRKEHLDLDSQVGQRFEPSDGEMGYNFAHLMSTFDDFISVPGSMYSARDYPTAPDATTPSSADAGNPMQQLMQQRQPAPSRTASQAQQQSSDSGPGNPNNTVHLRIHLDQSENRSHSISAAYPYPEPAAKPRRSPQPLPALESSTQPAPKTDLTSRSLSKPSRLSRRVTVGGVTSSTVPKSKLANTAPLETHYEEREQKDQPAPKASPEPDDDLDCEYSFPESLTPQKPPPRAQNNTTSRHRHSLSASTASPIPKPSSAAKVSTANPPLTSSPSLRRTRSRNGLRSASQGSHRGPSPEDGAAISAAMDMLSGSPPPPSASPIPAPIPRRPTRIQTDRDRNSTGSFPEIDMKLATPRTRSALADRMEIEKAERERVERRNGNLNSQFNGHTHQQQQQQQQKSDPHQDNSRTGDHASGPALATSKANITAAGMDDSTLATRAQERERARQKRYSMPVTATGIGYPSNSTFGGSSNHAGARSGDHPRPTSSGPDADASYVPMRAPSPPPPPPPSAFGNGRSSLMIPIGGPPRNKWDSGLGIGLGGSGGTAIANSLENAGGIVRGGGGGGGGGGGIGLAGGIAPGGSGGNFRRDSNSGVYSGYEYIE